MGPWRFSRPLPGSNQWKRFQTPLCRTSKQRKVQNKTTLWYLDHRNLCRIIKEGKIRCKKGYTWRIRWISQRLYTTHHNSRSSKWESIQRELSPWIQKANRWVCKAATSLVALSSNSLMLANSSTLSTSIFRVKRRVTILEPKRNQSINRNSLANNRKLTSQDKYQSANR